MQHHFRWPAPLVTSETYRIQEKGSQTPPLMKETWVSTKPRGPRNILMAISRKYSHHSSPYRALAGCRSLSSNMPPAWAQVIITLCCRQVSLLSDDLCFRLSNCGSPSLVLELWLSFFAVPVSPPSGPCVSSRRKYSLSLVHLSQDWISPLFFVSEIFGKNFHQI